MNTIPFLFTLFALISSEILCPFFHSVQYNITPSYPPCLNPSNEFLYRTCSNGSWTSEPRCCTIQQNCPEKFLNGGTFCYIFSEKSKFLPECPYEDILPFDSYKHVVSSNGPVWMPLRRNSSGFFQWIEASTHYKTIFNKNYTISSDSKTKNCLIYYGEDLIVTTSCEEKYPRICAYRKIYGTSNKMCQNLGACFESDYSGAKCFCLDETREYPMAGFLENYQNYVYKLLSNDTCTIGLEKTLQGVYIWSKTHEQLTYTYWAPDVTFKAALSCSSAEKTVDNLELSLELEFDTSQNIFVLKVTGKKNLKHDNNETLIFCFTDAHPTEILHRFFPLNETEDGIYSFGALEYGPGSCWCEAFKSDSSVVKSEVIFFKGTFLSEFVLTLRVESADNNVTNIVQNFFSEIYEINKIYIPRVMKVEAEDVNISLINLHFTLRNLTSPEDPEGSFLKTYIEDYLKNSSVFHLVEFLNSDFCLPMNDTLTWPEIKIGECTFSEEYCFLPNGSRPLRYCQGNFVDGAKWSLVNLNCERPTYSTLSEKLISLLSNISTENLYEISNVAQNYTELDSFDVYLIGELYSKIQPEEIRANNLSINEVFETINTLLKVDKAVLRRSEQKMKATNNLLKIIENFLNNKDGPEICIIKENVVLVSSDSENIAGIVVQTGISEPLVTVLRNYSTIEEILEIEDLQSAIWLSPKLRLQDSVKISILLFYTDGFFDETLTRIFSVQASESLESVGSITTIHKLNQKIGTFCVYWNYVNKGYWNRDNPVKKIGNFQTCEFWVFGNFALVSSSNITMNLRDILKNNYTTDETMKRLLEVSTKYEDFQSEDVFLVGEILNKVITKKIDLGVLAQIVSNSLKIDTGVLSESQENKMATDSILYTVDTIVKNSNHEKFLIITENFVVFITNEANFTGILVSDTVEILLGDVNIEDYSTSEFNSAVILSSELKQQLNSKIIILIFLKNVFFKNTNYSAFDTVFGVILPEIGEYLGPVSTYYQISDDVKQTNCVHWSYDVPNNIHGSWVQDTKSQNSSSMVRCDFWHTTHLGLLLLEEDKYEDVFNLMEFINLINGILSLMGVFGIILTAVLFEKWRRNKGNQILLNFIVSVTIQIVMFYISSEVSNNTKLYGVCITIGAILHYSILSQFSWMFIIGVLQFKRFVLVFAATPKYLLLKACVFGWGLPLVIVSIVLIFDQESYLNANINFCYPSGLSLALGVWLPIGITVTFNLGIFIYILYSVCHRKLECNSDSGTFEILHQWRLAVLLFFLLGITWMFGLLANLKFGIVFIYLFNFTANLQGVIIFFYFIVFNKNTRRLYSKAFNKCFNRDY